MAQGTNRIATLRVKHNIDYQEQRGIAIGPAKGLTPELQARIPNMVKRICRALDIDGYARIDFRLSAEGVPYFLEANPNPEIAREEEFADSAKHDKIDYPELLERLLQLGIGRARALEWAD
jgi:D-alanine-D-alanine ligase